MRVFLQTLGCRLNEAEANRWGRELRSLGYRIAEEACGADLVVVNTCAVTEEAVRKSRKLIRRAHRDNPRAKLVVSGCYATLEGPTLPGELGIDLVVGNEDKDQLVEIARRQLDLTTMPELATSPGENGFIERGRHRAFVKIQDGCRYRCSFCIVTVARGEERSRPIPAVIEEINGLAARGCREVVLAGVHIGGYGSDIGASLTELVGAVLDETDIPRLRLGSVEPWELSGDFWALFENPRLMPHLHLPLQSGADSVLRRMSRRCRSAEFLELIAEARRRVADFNATTDVIVGFPGESEAEWRQTVELVRQIGFGHLHVFAFSPRAGTKAASLPNPVRREVQRARSLELHRVGQRLKRQTLRQYLGRELPVLLESTAPPAPGEPVRWRGYTHNFLRVAVEAADQAELGGQIRRVRLEAVADSGEEILARVAD